MINKLQELILARAPCGQEGELREVLKKHLLRLVDKVWVDPAGNLVAKKEGKYKSRPPIRLMAHMDELSLVVKCIDDDGAIRVEPMGVFLPSSFGQGPVELLSDSGIVSGILSFGSFHTSNPNKANSWEDVSIFTRTLKGIYPGTKVVIARARREIFLFEDVIGGYFLDNRAGIMACLLALQKLDNPPEQDIYFVATAQEESGGIGACYAARTLPGDITLAVDVGPVAKEYQTKFSPDPIIVYQDSSAIYDHAINRHLITLANSLKIPYQRAIFANYGSDASISMRSGQSARAALLAFPVCNTHGYEAIHRDALETLSTLLAAFLRHQTLLQKRNK